MPDLKFRPFGLFESDLNIDFQRLPCPYLVTQVLQCCVANSTEDHSESEDFWGLTVGKRIEYLLHIVAPMRAGDLTVQLNCHNAACGQIIEVELSIDELIHLGHQTSDLDNVQIAIDGNLFSFRKPTGADQREWLRRTFNDETNAKKVILRTLLAVPAKTSKVASILDENISVIEQVFQDEDPLVGYQIIIHCPYCERDLPYEIALQEFLLAEMQKVQARLLKDIHQLALHYHWGEGQIITLPKWRRDQYLAYLEGEKN
jgi:hypothetical protein